MRILAVTNMYPTPQHPSAGIFVHQQIRGLRQIGLDVEVMLTDRSSEGRRTYWRLGRRLQARLKSFCPDVVHAMYGGVIADLTTTAAGRTPVVVSFCGSDLLGSTLAGPLQHLSARYGVMASHRAARKASAIVVKSKNLRDALSDSVDSFKIRVIPNGIDLQRFRPVDRDACRSRLAWRPDGFHVLFCSNAKDPGKRPALAHAAVDALKAMGIAAELHHLTGVPPEDVPVWLNASNVLLLTSLTEGSPNIVKEALACDVPLVSVRVGDVGEQIRGITGCHLASADPDNLAEKLRTVADTPPWRVDGRTRMQELSLERVAWRVKTVYEEVLEAGGNGRTEHVEEKSF